MGVLSEKGIRHRYLRMTTSFLLAVLIMGGVSYLHMTSIQKEMAEQQEYLHEKQQLMESLKTSLNNVFFRARGFYAFQNERELVMVYEQINEVNRSIAKLKDLTLTNEEQQMVNDLADFLTVYENDSFPQAVEYVRASDYESLRDLSNSGLNDTVNEFVAYADEYAIKVDNELETLTGETLQQANVFTFVMLGLAVLLFVIITFIIWRTINDIVKPLERMKRAIDQFKSDQQVLIATEQRFDEIGVLSQSIVDMIHMIQEKEEELTAQNEELIMQQGELQDRQVKLEESLSETELTKNRLERYNGLNHILSFTLDKQELANAMLAYFDDVYDLDIGLFFLPKTGEYAVKGFTNHMFQELQDHRMPYVEKRLDETSYFTMKRKADKEKGFSTGTVYVYDFYAGVKGSGSDCVAMICLSRVGREFSTEEQEEIFGLLSRGHLAIERIQLYDRAVHERMLNERIVNNINEGIQFVGIDGTMLQHNEALFHMLDCGNVPLDAAVEKERWVSKLANQTEDPQKMFQFFEKCLLKGEHGVHHYRYRAVEPSGRVIDVYSAPVLIDGEKTGTIFVHRDITKEYEVDRMKTELVSTVSHELRTPLSSVLGFTELLLHKQLKPEKQKKYLETIYKEAKRLTNLINDFLDLQRMESGSQVYRMEQLAVNELVVETAARFRTESSHPLAIVDEATDVFIEGDRERMEQVLTNLIGNAIKFSPNGGHVTITMSNETDQLVVSIRDEGIGIPAEDVPKLFSKFHRIDNSARRKIGGTGLGLAICWEIIQKHGGTITIESEEGKGTIVRFSLPLVSTAANHMAHYEGLEGSPTVMIVEDDISLALLLSEELKMNGFKVLYHTIPSDAFEEAKRTPLIGAVIDIMLGDELDGWDLVHLLKEEEQTKHIPIIISSALDPAAEVEKLNQIDHYLTKPYPPKQLSKAILDFLSEPVQRGVILYPEEGSEHAESE